MYISRFRQNLIKYPIQNNISEDILDPKILFKLLVLEIFLYPRYKTKSWNKCL